jgi:glutathione synthase/RimK-type ligase-like ATP-grasp enzyme
MLDITILTDKRFVDPKEITPYIQNVLDEDNALLVALEQKGLKVIRTNWDNPHFDWSSTKYIIFRTTWDYFDRFDEFSIWLEKVNKLTTLINPKSLIYWNIDKHYLQDLEKLGVRIPPTLFIEQKDNRSLEEIIASSTWEEFILKPAISGAARHTYKISRDEITNYESKFSELIANESMLIQEYQKQITTKGEIAFMVFGGKFSHAILKKAKSGDFRVQDDFGGTVESYKPNSDEILFAESIVNKLSPIPVYARVDVIWDNNDDLCIGEIELIEPELWFRMDPNAALKCAKAIKEFISNTNN